MVADWPPTFENRYDASFDENEDYRGEIPGKDFSWGQYIKQQGLSIAEWFLRVNKLNPENSSDWNGFPQPFGRRDDNGILRLPQLRRFVANQQMAMRRATGASPNRALKKQFKPIVKDTAMTVRRLNRIMNQIDRIERTEGYKHIWLIMDKSVRTRQRPDLTVEQIESFYRLNQLVARAYQTLYDSIALMRSMTMDMEAANLTSVIQGESTQVTMARLQRSSSQLRHMAESLGELYPSV